MSEQISYVGEQGGDSYLDVIFYQGHWEGEDCDFIRINVPGDKTVTIDTKADDVHKARFKRQYEAFKGFKDLTGHPVDEWDEIPKSLRTELMYQGFKFVDQIAGAPDSAFARMMGGTQIRNKAQAYLNRGKIDADVVIKEQQEQIKALQDQMAILMDSMVEKPKRSRKTTATDEVILEE